jgi:hypothetical protein
VPEEEKEEDNLLFDGMYITEQDPAGGEDDPFLTLKEKKVVKKHLKRELKPMKLKTQTHLVTLKVKPILLVRLR